MGRLDGRLALVTGAGRGFGRAIALAFGREGADLVVNYNASGPGAKEVVAELERLGRRAEAVQADVANADQVRAMVDRALTRFGRLDILVNNAGISRASVGDPDGLDGWQRLIAVNQTSVFLGTKLAAEQMAKTCRGTTAEVF